MSKTAISYTTLRRLRGQGLKNAEIAAQVGLTPQGVSYRLRGLKRMPAQRRHHGSRYGVLPSTVRPTEWHPRVAPEPPSVCEVVGCLRPVGRGQRAKGPASLLPEPDCCRYCARPLTEEAQQRAPRDGFIRFMAALEAREAVHPTVRGTGLAEESA